MRQPLTWIAVALMLTGALMLVTDVGAAGLWIIVITIGIAFWWKRSSKPVAGKIVAVLSSILLALLTVAMLAMSGKWGS